MSAPTPSALSPATLEIVSSALDQLYQVDLALRSAALALEQAGVDAKMVEHFRDGRRIVGNVYGELKADRHTVARELERSRAAAVAL